MKHAEIYWLIVDFAASCIYIKYILILFLREILMRISQNDAVIAILAVVAFSIAFSALYFFK